MTIFELRQRRASVWAQMQDLSERADAEQRVMSAEEINQWEALESELSALTKQIEIAEREAELRRTYAETAERPVIQAVAKPEQDRLRVAFDRYLRAGLEGMSGDERAALGELRALGVGTGAAGGFTVPEGFRAMVTDTAKGFGAMFRLAEIVPTTSGIALPWPTADDTGNIGDILTENTQAAEQDLSFGQKQLGAYTYTSKLVRVSQQLLTDSGIDIEAFLARKLGERIGRAQGAHFVTGTGTGQPQGAVTGATAGKVGGTGQTTSVTYDDLVDLVYAVDPAYRRNAAWLMADSSIAKIRKLKDSQGQPLWTPAVAAGEPDTLLGFPVVAENAMPAMAANAKSILFGDFRAGYVIREVLEIVLLRLSERYADFLQVGFLAFHRADGLVQQPAAIKYYQNSAT